MLWWAAVMADRVRGAWLVRCAGAGHGLVCQYPERLGEMIDTFLRVTDAGPK